MDKHDSLDFLRNEIKLGEAVEDMRKMGSTLLESNQNTRKVILTETSHLQIFKKHIKALGRNVIVGKDRFFTAAGYWRLYLEKQWLLLETLERMKAAGLIYFFLNELNKVTEKRNGDKLVDDISSKVSPNEDDNRVGFSDDSVSAEAFPLLIYCMSACAVFGLMNDIVIPARMAMWRKYFMREQLAMFMSLMYRKLWLTLVS